MELPSLGQVASRSRAAITPQGAFGPNGQRAIAKSPPLASQAIGNINCQIFAEWGIYGCMLIAGKPQ
jgi:hypothetical protein